MNEPLIEFNPKLPKLSKNEKEVLKLLVEAGKLIVPIYLEQEKDLRIELSRKEIEKAAKKDPSLLSPYTAIEKSNGKLRAIPYHVKYADLLKPITDKLDQASEVTDNKEFARFLELQAKALTDGSYEKSYAAWIKMRPYIIDISIGPYMFATRLYAEKAAYLAWVGVLDEAGTQRLNDYKSITLAERRKALVPNERIENPHNVKAKTIDEILLAGLPARGKFVGLNLPKDMEFVEKYGSEVTIFNQANNLRLNEQIMPTFKRIFSPGFKEGFTEEDLRRASLRYVALHELAHNFLYYKHSVKNLQDLFTTVCELTATLLGMRIAGSLLLKSRITNKQLESMIVAFICRSMDLIEKGRKNELLIDYALGGAIFINFMLESGAIRQTSGLAITNFTKIFLALHELSYIMERLLASGTRKEAEKLIDKYGQLNKS